MFSRFSRVTFSVVSALSIVLTMVLGAPGTVLCMARDHTAIEAAQDGKCCSCLGRPTGKEASLSGRNAGSTECSSCLDIPLGGEMTSPAAPIRLSGAQKVVASAMPLDAHPTVRAILACAPSFSSKDFAGRASIIASSSILRI
jgi:hypothetical protein